MADNGNGRFQIAFWVMATVCFGGLILVGNSVIANDRIYSQERTRIETEARDDRQDMYDCFANKLELILIKLAKIEQRVGQ